MPARLILNADDFGLTPGVNRAIEELHRAGAVTSTSLMATGAAFQDAVAIALRNPSLGVGCHITLTDGIPVSHPDDIPSLLGADGKTFRPSLLDFLQALLRGTVSALEIVRESQAQIQLLQRSGIDVTHVDTHKHTHIFPAVAEPLLYAAHRCGVSAVRNPFEPGHTTAPFTTAPLLRRLLIRAVSLLEPRFRRIPQLKRAELQTTHGTLGISATGSLDTPSLRAILHSMLPASEDGRLYELCCHPGYNDSALDAIPTRLRASRDLERRALLREVPEILTIANAPQLIHYGNLGIAGLQRASGQFRPNTGFEKVF
jgi:predicted glycoside hydrolase/deacetylase ChbG (UPF0249 family)